MRNNRIATALLALALLAATAIGAQAVRGAAASGEPAAFITIDGRHIGAADLRGKIVLVNFWATTCQICMAEMPDLVATYRQYRPRGLEVIAVAMPYDDVHAVRRYAAQQALPFPVVFDHGGALVRAYEQVKATPVTFILGPSGQRISKTVGIIDFTKLRAFLDTSLPAAPAS